MRNPVEARVRTHTEFLECYFSTVVEPILLEGESGARARAFSKIRLSDGFGKCPVQHSCAGWRGSRSGFGGNGVTCARKLEVRLPNAGRLALDSFFGL